MHDTRAFAPIYIQSNPVLLQVGDCYLSTTVAASNGVAVASAAFAGNNENNFVQLRIANKTSVWVHVNFGVLLGGQAVRPATLNDMPIAPGAVEIVTVNSEVNAASVFADGAPSASTSVIFTRGDGV